MLNMIDALFLVECVAQEEALFKGLERAPGPVILSFVNAHGLNLCWTDHEILSDFAASDWILRDGSGMSVHLRLLGRSPGRDMNGTDLIPRLLRRFAARRVALMGSRDPYLCTAARVLSERGVNIVQKEHGFHTQDYYEEAFLDHRPGLVILGMGMPRQEQLAVRLRALGTWPCIIVNGGAILDFLGGRFPRAPWILRVLGLEWTYRLWQEPRRLCRRYTIGNLLFLGRTIQLMNFQRRPNRDTTRASKSSAEKRL